MKIIGQIIDYLTKIAMVAMLAIMLLTAVDVFMRYVFSNPITGTTELTEYGMIVIFCAIGAVTLFRRHIAVDLVIDLFSPRTQRITDFITLFISLVICTVLTWRGFVEAVITQRINITSSLLEIPEAIFRYVLAIAFGFICIVVLCQLIEHTAKAVKK
jgi:TRAP-type C4-dicarboxylate transport system permease small subunit